jgi:hypothetical protein
MMIAVRARECGGVFVAVADRGHHRGRPVFYTPGFVTLD